MTRTKNTGDLKQMQKSNGDWVPCHAYRKLADGTVQVLTEADGTREANTGKKRIPNVAEGFFANGVFHPIRASWDYDRRRAKEEGPSAELKRARATKPKVIGRKRAKTRKPPANRGTSRSRVYPGD